MFFSNDINTLQKLYMSSNTLIQTRSFLKGCRQFMKRLKQFQTHVQHLAIGKSSKTNKHFVHKLRQNKSVLRHFSISKHTNIMPYKYIFFIGERHVHDHTTNAYLDEITRMLKTLHKKRKGPSRIHCFIELPPDETKSELSRHYKHPSVFKHIYKTVHKQRLSRIRVHRIDIRFREHSPLAVLRDIDRALLLHDFTTVNKLLKKVVYVLDPKHIKHTHSFLYNQFKKNHRLELLLPLFSYFFGAYYEQLRQHGKCTHHMIMMIHAFFMDLYTIGQLMNPKYKYCVFFGGCGHTRSILRAMDLMNILKKTGNEYVTCPVSFYPLIARKGVLF